MSTRFRTSLLLILAAVALAVLVAAPGGRAQEPAAGPRIYVASRGADAVSVLDPTRPSPLLAILPYTGAPNDVAVSGDGSRVYIADNRTSRVEVLEALTGRALASIPTPGGPISLAMSPDGERLYAAGSSDNSLSIISISQNRVVSRRGVGDRPVDVAISPDGARIFVSHEREGRVWVMTANAGVVLGTPTTGPGTSGAAIAPSGNFYVIRGIARSMVVMSAASRVIAEVGLPGPPRAVALDPDGRWVYATTGNVLSVIDTRTNRLALTLPVGTGASGLAVNASAKRVLVTNAGSGTVTRVDTTTNQVLNTIAVGGSPQEIALSPDGSRGFTTGPVGVTSGSLTVFDPERLDQRRVATLRVQRPRGIVLSPDHTRAWIASAAGTLAEVNTETNQITRTIAVGQNPSALAVHPDGSRVYVANEASSTLSIVPTDPANPAVRTLPVGDRPVSVAAAPDGRRVYVLSAGSREISVIETAGDTEAERLFLGTNGPSRLLVSPDSRRLYATSSGSALLSEFDVTRPRPAPVHTTLPYRPFGLDSAPGGRPLFVAGSGNLGEGLLGFLDATAAPRLLDTLSLSASSAPLGVYTARDGARVYVTHSPHPVISAVDPAARRVADVLLVEGDPLDVVVKP